MTKTVTARSPEDILALVPVVLGFVPSESVVMLTLGATHTFHARVDLPNEPRLVGDVVATLLEPATRHQVGGVVFVIYSEDAQTAARMVRRLVRSFERAGIRVVDVIRADGHRWFPMLRSSRGADPQGVPYDVSAHPFAAEAVLDGRVTHASRRELAATLRADPARVRSVLAARTSGPVTAAPAWVAATVERHVAAGSTPDDPEAARLLDALSDPVARDAAWDRMRRPTVRADVAFWSDLVRRAPTDVVAHAAAVLAFAAWLAGDGALAWCAVDRAQAADPDHTLARLVGDMLTAAVPPTAWEEVVATRDEDAGETA